jgi:hypothetical protein
MANFFYGTHILQKRKDQKTGVGGRGALLIFAD